jgi:hypothetical protein
MTTSQQMALDGTVKAKKFGEGWTKEDWENFYSDSFDSEQAGLPDWQKRSYP